MTRRASVFGVIAGLAVSLAAQQPESVLQRVRTLGLPEAPGSVPVIYVGSAKERALRLQKSLEAAHSWYENQLRLRVPIVLAVLDPEAGDKISIPIGLPLSRFGDSGPGIVIIPAIVRNAPPAGHEGFLEHEPAQFHEDGHILAGGR